MEDYKRMPLCDISAFKPGILPDNEQIQNKMKRHSSRNIGKKVYYTPVKKSKYNEKNVKEESNGSENEDNGSEDQSRESTLRKHVREEKYVFAYEDSQTGDLSEDESPKKRKRYGKLDEDPNDEDYEPDYNETDYSVEKSFKKEPIFKIKTEKLTEYELMVQKNRDEKMAFLKSLKFDEVKEGLSVAVKRFKEKRKPAKRTTPPKKKTPLPPRRKSLRIAGEKVDLSEKAIAARIEAEAIQDTQTKKLPACLLFENALQEDYSYENFSKEFGKLDYGRAEPFNEHMSHFDTMQLPDSQICKVVPARITSLTFHPMKENILVAAGSKYGQVGLWKVNSREKSFVFEPHTEGITNLKFNPEHPQLIVSSSYDGTVRCGDVEKAVFNEAYNVSEETCCTYFDFLSHSTYLVAQKDGMVSVVDYRGGRIKAAAKKHQCHDVAVKTVSVHPTDKNYFVSADRRGSIKLWDLRKLQAQPIVEVQHHKRCVQSAFFSPLTGKYVLSTSSDDSICIFDGSNLGKNLMLQHSMKHNNNTGRWLTVFRSTWIPNTDDAFVVGSMLYPRRIEIYNSKMDNIFNFTHENLGCITSVNMFHPSLPVLAGANSSGKVYVFSSEDIL